MNANADDETLRRKYFGLIAIALDLDPKETFEVEYTRRTDLEAVEYFLKDVSQRSLNTNATLKECAKEFNERIKLLRELDKKEWEYLEQAISANAFFLGHKIIMDFHRAKAKLTRMAKTEEVFIS